ncbi:hypothetical protein ZIOFF_016526 [Zingiber officinale]|uniref:Gag-pol polyprotein n=1 Tax=Zingiber officinale TaxID=94328 RepID=A0A8J5HEI1_ZINOF|nr:hypothetical protein ZIOFF_016526 [Zingiber officinale]
MSMGNPIMSLLANNTLIGENFPKWKSNINIVLVSENNRFVLTEECPPILPANAARAVREQYDRWVASNNKAKAYMLASMSDALRSKMEPKECAFEIMESLQEMFGQQSEQARHEATRKYTNARMILGTHVRDHVMQMTNYFSEAEMHGVVIDEGTQVSIILNSFPSDFIPFTNNYIMNELNYGMTQLLNELQTFEAISGLVKNKAKANIVDKPNSSKGLKRKMAKGSKFGGKFKKTKDRLWLYNLVVSLINKSTALCISSKRSIAPLWLGHSSKVIIKADREMDSNAICKKPIVIAIWLAQKMKKTRAA